MPTIVIRRLAKCTRKTAGPPRTGTTCFGLYDTQSRRESKHLNPKKRSPLVDNCGPTWGATTAVGEHPRNAEMSLARCESSPHSEAECEPHKRGVGPALPEGQRHPRSLVTSADVGPREDLAAHCESIKDGKLSGRAGGARRRMPRDSALDCGGGEAAGSIPVQSQIEPYRRMRQGTNADPFDARFRHGAYRAEDHPA